MREKINSNPVFQVVLVGFLGIVVAFLFMTRVMGGEDAEPAPATTEATATPAPSAESAAVPTDPALPADPAMAAPAPVEVPGDSGFVAGPGLPKPVVAAYESGDAIVLLVSKADGIEDKRVRAEVTSLRNRPDTSVFMTDSNKVATYSRIAQGVDLDRVPALVVVKPRSVTGPGLPEASVAYGFRGPESVAQAVRDALYKGRELPYHPG